MPLWLAFAIVALPAIVAAWLALDAFRTTSRPKATWAIAFSGITAITGIGVSIVLLVAAFDQLGGVPVEHRSEVLAAGIERGAWPGTAGMAAGALLGFLSGLVRGLVASRTFGPPPT